MAGAVLIWILTFVRVYRGVTQVEEPPLTVPERDAWPRVAMVVPVRNEEEWLPASLPTLVSQDLPGLEIFIVDDCSTDGTPGILKDFAAAHPRLHVIEGKPHPPGWVGKPWALHQAIQASSGPDATPWIMMVDADIRLHPSTARIALHEAERRGADLYSIAPSPECQTFWQRLTAMSMISAILTLFPAHRVNDPASKEALLAGGFLLIKREVHTAMGGEESVGHEIAEDLKRAVRAKAAGYRIHLAFTRHLAFHHWYGTLADIWNALRKNAYAGLEYNPVLLVLSIVIGVWVHGLPIAATVIQLKALLTGAALSLFQIVTAVTYWVLAILVVQPALRVLRTTPLFGILHPFGALVFLMIACTSAWDYHFGGGPRWKGRSFGANVVKKR